MNLEAYWSRKNATEGSCYCCKSPPPPPPPLSGAGLKPGKFAFLTPEFAFLTSNCSRNDKFFQFISFLIWAPESRHPTVVTTIKSNLVASGLVGKYLPHQPTNYKSNWVCDLILAGATLGQDFVYWPRNTGWL